MHTRSAVYTFIKFHLEGKGGECLSVCAHAILFFKVRGNKGARADLTVLC